MSDEQRRKESDVVWSTMTQGHYCKFCGCPAIHAAGEFICVNDPDCLIEMQAEAREEEALLPDCAPEGLASIERVA